ncbi:MAG: type 1 glutamine amidotransferase, partial [Octadecabacter sp.]|nr:type 1 glutamine amidotransferase [Octadecabacter sp.]
QVTKQPEDAVVVASNPFCENAALVYGNKIFTVQAHPEFNGDIIDGLIKYRGGAIPADLIADAKASLQADVDNATIARQMGQFLKTGAL